MNKDDMGRGIGCSFDGVVIGDPAFRMTKNGTLPLLTLTIVVTEYDGKTSICRVNQFGHTAKVLADNLARGSAVHVDGYVSLNHWIKDGVERSGLCVMAMQIQPVDGGRGDSLSPSIDRSQ